MKERPGEMEMAAQWAVTDSVLGHTGEWLMDLFRAQFSKDSVARSFGLAWDGGDARNPVL